MINDHNHLQLLCVTKPQSSYTRQPHIQTDIERPLDRTVNKHSAGACHQAVALQPVTPFWGKTYPLWLIKDQSSLVFPLAVLETLPRKLSFIFLICGNAFNKDNRRAILHCFSWWSVQRKPGRQPIEKYKSSVKYRKQQNIEIRQYLQVQLPLF